nr:ShET2/EspL2 family type III secretion system effector toxin [Dyella sp. M7H15-1]
MPYLSKINAYPPASLNGVATFPTPADSPLEVIACRHLAAQYLYDCLHDDAGKVDLDHFESVEQIAQHVSENGTQADYENMRRDAQEAHLIKTDHLGKLLMEQFEKIETENASSAGIGVRGLLLESTNHSMAIRLRVKQDRDDPNKKIYVVKFYDPNMTDTTVRCEVDDLSKLNGQTLRQYIDGDGQHDPYYQHYFSSNEDCVMVHVCSHQATEQPPLQTSQGKVLTSRCEGLSPAVMWHLLRDNCSVDLAGLSADFANLDVETQVRLLTAKDMNGTPGFYMALQNGHAEAIRAYGELLKQLPEEVSAKPIVTPAKPIVTPVKLIVTPVKLIVTPTKPIVTLLEAKIANGTSGLYIALQNGHAEAIRAYGELLKQVGNVSLVKLLEAKSADGTSGLFMALHAGHAEAIRAYGELLKQLPKGARDRSLFKLLDAIGADGTTGLYAALQNGHAEAIRAYGELLEQLPKEARAKLLVKRLNANGVSGLQVALQNGHAEAIRAYGELLKQLPEEAQAQVLVTLLEAKDVDGTSGLSVALEEGHTEAIQAYEALLKELMSAMLSA